MISFNQKEGQIPTEFKKIVKKNNFKIFDMRNLYSSKLMKKNKINYFGIGK